MTNASQPKFSRRSIPNFNVEVLIDGCPSLERARAFFRHLAGIAGATKR